MMSIKFVRTTLVILVCAVVAACGSNKKSIAMKLHSDPLGAYALMQVKYKGKEDADWVFLGSTPVVQERKVAFEGASSVSLKVIRPGFFEQVKTWKTREFLKEHKRNNGILWVPNMVKQ